MIRNDRKLEVYDGIAMMMALPLSQEDWIVVNRGRAPARLRGFADLGGVPAGRLRALSDVF